MGGQNHQPTNRKITAVSAWLSQRVGEGFASVLEANNHLENAIMLGMNKLHIEDLAASLTGAPADHVAKTIECLEHSTRNLVEIQTGFKRLLDVAIIEGYKGNPLASKLGSLQLKAGFEGVLVQPFANSRVWNELEDRIQNHNILDTLAWEAEQFKQLEIPTRNLIATLQECRRIAEMESGHAMADAIENNEVPLRQYYAQVFSLWNTLHAMFLYSALMMTELFYRVNAYPSLLEFDPTAVGVRAA